MVDLFVYYTSGVQVEYSVYYTGLFGLQVEHRWSVGGEFRILYCGVYV